MRRSFRVRLQVVSLPVTSRHLADYGQNLIAREPDYVTLGYFNRVAAEVWIPVHGSARLLLNSHRRQ